MSARKILLLTAATAVGLISAVSLLAEDQPKQSWTVDELKQMWQTNYNKSQSGEELIKPEMNPGNDQSGLSASMSGPNAFVHGAPPSPAGENNNSSVAWSRTTAGEVYTVFNEYSGVGAVPVFCGVAWSGTGGFPGTWMNLGFVAGGPYPEENNPTVSGHPLGGFLRASAGKGGPNFAAVPSGIVAAASPGGGANFGASVGPIMANAPGVNWLDYPYSVIDEGPGTAAPQFGAHHIAWVEFIDGDGDPNGDLNLFNDGGDAFQIWYSFSNTVGGGPSPFPGYAPPVAIGPPLAVFGGAPQTHRPSMDIADVVPTPAVPVGGGYIAWTDGFAVFVDASGAPALGAPWGALGGGPVVAAVIAAPFPPVLPNGPPTMITNSVSIVVDNGASGCPGQLHLTYLDGPAGDPTDIMYVTSFDGGFTWSPPLRVNCDPPGGLQWAPQMRQDPASGELIIVYYDQRVAPTAGNEVWASISRDCGASWVDAQISDAGPLPSFTSIFGNPGAAGAAWVGEYLGVDRVFGAPFAMTFNDGRNGADQDVQFETIVDVDLDCDLWPASVDCDDTDPTVNPGVDADGDGSSICSDCDDTDASVYPGAPELCDGKDNDCNGFVDDAGDADGDGVSICTDCDDTNASVYPGAPELCDGLDNDCNSIVDDVPDADGDGVNACTDCDDTDATVFPGAAEICDGKDNDCNGLVDDVGDADGDGVSSCTDCDDTNPNVYPGAPEFCDGLDTDCNSIVDDSGATGCVTYYMDADGDGFGSSVALGCFCSPPPGSSTNNSDCNDTNASIHPGAPEPCDLIDNDCNGIIDDAPDADGDGFNACIDCDDGNSAVHPGALEICADGLDNDCNGLIDGADPACLLGCCTLAGDANNDTGVNIADVTFLIARIFSGGPPPPCCEEGSANGDAMVNIADVTYLISRIFSGGPAPICGPAGMLCTPE